MGTRPMAMITAVRSGTRSAKSGFYETLAQSKCSRGDGPYMSIVEQSDMVQLRKVLVNPGGLVITCQCILE